MARCPHCGGDVDDGGVWKVREVLHRLRVDGDPTRALVRLVLSLPWPDVERAVDEVHARHVDGTIRNPVGYLTVCLRERAREQRGA
jgi:hypothetical protein